MACRVYKYSLIISIEKQANGFHFYWITAYCWFIKFRLTFVESKTTELKEPQGSRGCVCVLGLLNVDTRLLAFTGRCKETGSDWQLSVLLAELFCEWWWGLSDNVGLDERRHANAGSVLWGDSISLNKYRHTAFTYRICPRATGSADTRWVWYIHPRGCDIWGLSSRWRGH